MLSTSSSEVARGQVVEHDSTNGLVADAQPEVEQWERIRAPSSATAFDPETITETA